MASEQNKHTKLTFQFIVEYILNGKMAYMNSRGKSYLDTMGQN